LRFVVLATNSRRQMTVAPHDAAGKPFRLAAYRGLPRPGIVVGDQVTIDGALA